MTPRIPPALSRFAFAAMFLGLGLTPAVAKADSTRLLPGEKTYLSGEFTFVFWMDFERYKILTNGEEQDLIRNPVITAPAGVTVQTLEVSIRLEDYTSSPHPALKGKQTVQKYQRYVVKGRWEVRTDSKVAVGKHSIGISFPRIESTAKELGAGKKDYRGVSSGLSLGFEVFADRAALEASTVKEKSSQSSESTLLIVIWVVVGAIVLFVVGSLIYIVALSTGLVKPKLTESEKAKLRRIEDAIRREQLPSQHR